MLTFQRKNARGSLKDDSGVRPRRIQSASRLEYSLTKTSAPGGSLSTLKVRDISGHSRTSTGSVGTICSTCSASATAAMYFR